MKHGSLNPITGDQIKTRVSDTYADKFDGIDWSVKLEKEEPDKKEDEKLPE
jgi:hypothetical protein